MDSERRGGWIQTFTGGRYWPLDPRPTDVCLEDIAHHLSMLCRFVGACTRFYSVAEHSVHVSRLMPPRLALRGLLHDAAEAYCNDIARPVKRDLVGYAEIEGLNEAVIFERFGLPGVGPEDQRALKAADNAMLVAEQHWVMAPCDHRWQPQEVPEHLLVRANDHLRRAAPGWGHGRAEWEFLQRFKELTG
jgi:5'-deoxynucleotidase YfbR-like HD superfamily hydrolase